MHVAHERCKVRTGRGRSGGGRGRDGGRGSCGSGSGSSSSSGRGRGGARSTGALLGLGDLGLSLGDISDGIADLGALTLLQGRGEPGCAEGWTSKKDRADSSSPR